MLMITERAKKMAPSKFSVCFFEWSHIHHLHLVSFCVLSLSAIARKLLLCFLTPAGDAEFPSAAESLSLSLSLCFHEAPQNLHHSQRSFSYRARNSACSWPFLCGRFNRRLGLGFWLLLGMDRNREGRRAGGAAAASGVLSANRRLRAKDASDDEDRMEEATESRAWERPKKERVTTFHVSASSNPRNKRKLLGLPQESQASGRTGVTAEDADESAEETEIAASEDDDEPPPPPILRRPGKSRVHAKEDEIVMDIPAVPRKARSSISSSSRFSSISRRQQESVSADISRQKSPVTMQTSLNGSSSPNILQKPGRRLKSVGTKFRAMKVPKVSEPSTISDQEVEVAEALFVLARSMPSHAGLLEFEAKLETEARTPSPPGGLPSSMAVPSISGPSPINLHNSGSTTNGYVSSHIKESTGPVVEAPKRKRPRVVSKQEEGRDPTPVRLVASGAVSSAASPSGLIHSSVGETEPDPLREKALFVAADAFSLPSESLKGNATTEVSHSAPPQLHNSEEMKTGCLEHEGIEQGEAKVPKQETQSNADTGEQESGRSDIVRSPLNVKHVDTADIPAENGGLSKRELPSRPVDVLHDNDGGISKLKIDLMAAPMKLFSTEEDAPGLPTEKQSLGNNTSINLTNYNMEALNGIVEEPLKQSLVMEDAVKGLDADKGSLKPKERVDGEKQEPKQEFEEQMNDHQQIEQIASQIVRGPKEGDKEKEKEPAKFFSKYQKDDTDNAVASSFISSTPSIAASSSAPAALNGWIGGLPQLGYYGSGATPWAAGASLPSPNLDVKTAHPAMQLPHAAILPPVPRMKRCATHVYVAHFIYREQVSQHSLWSAALYRATPYNLNIPPVNMLDNEKLGGAYADVTRKASTQKSGPSYGYTISQSSGPGITGSSCTPGSGATGTIPAPNHPTGGGVAIDTGTGTASGNVMAAHAQYFQAMMQQNGFASFSFPFNGPTGQAAQFFNSPFFQPHLMPPLPHLQPLAQQGANVLPVQKQQQGMGTSPHSSSAQLVETTLQQQLAPQSPSHSQQQQHNHMGTLAQHFGAHPEKESTVGGECLSTAESRLCAMQRSGLSSLPNLNISPSSLMLATSIPAMSSHDQDASLMATSGGKQTGKSQQQAQFQGQNPSSLSTSMQQQQFIQQNTGSGPGIQMRALDQPLSQGYSAIAMSGANRGSVGLGPLGLVSVASMMATQSHGVLPGSCENTRVHVQQQQGFGGHNQQYQRTISKAAAASEDAYTAKGRDYAEDKKPSMKQVGAPSHLSRVEMEASSPTSGSGASTTRLTSNVGRTLTSATPTEARSSRSASSVGAGQIPLLQTQPPKQAVGRTKAVSGTNVASTTAAHTVSAYTERVLPGKFSGTVLPFSGQMAPSSQGSKQTHAGMVKVGQRMPPGPAQQVPTSAMAKSQGQQARSNQQGVPSTPPRMPPLVSAPILTSGTLSMATSHSLSVPKAAAGSASKSPSNGKGNASLTKTGPPSKKPPVSGPTICSVGTPVQNMSVKAPIQQKSQAALHAPQFPQQQPSIPAQQQRVGTKNQVYPQLQPQQGQYKQSFQQQSPYRSQVFLQQHQQQYLQQSPSQQQQALPQHTQFPVPHHYQQNPQNLPTQHGQAQQHVRHDPQLSHLQQQFQPSSSPPTLAANNGLSFSSPNLTLGTAISGNISSSASSDGADQFKGSGARANPPKTAYSSGNPLPSGGMPEMITAAHSTVSGQANSPHSSSSHYLQQKPSPDGVNREEMNSVRHLPSSSPSQAAVASNPPSS